MALLDPSDADLPTVREIPRDSGFDRSLSFLNEGYAFVRRRCSRMGTDVFRTRLLLQPTICMLGRDAAEVFYDAKRFQRAGAAPRRLPKTLFGRDGVQDLDGDDHLDRRGMLRSVLVRERMENLVADVRSRFQTAAAQWERSRAGHIALFHEATDVLGRAVFAWAGVPVSGSEATRRCRDLARIIDSPGSTGPRYIRGRLARVRSDHWIAGHVAAVRKGRRKEPCTPLEHIALHRDRSGERLPRHVASVEVLNLLRPTVAVARYLVFLAHALHEHPDCQKKAAMDDQFLRWLVLETRRFYPFFPLVAARTRTEFLWRGMRFPPGIRTLLDLYGTNHDARIWGDPEAFRPERFRDWKGDPFALIPQGGGDAEAGHRCVGEWLTVALMESFAAFLTREVGYDVPPQDLTIDLARMPALPASGLLLTNVRTRGR